MCGTPDAHGATDRSGDGAMKHIHVRRDGSETLLQGARFHHWSQLRDTPPRRPGARAACREHEAINVFVLKS